MEDDLQKLDKIERETHGRSLQAIRLLAAICTTALVLLEITISFKSQSSLQFQTESYGLVDESEVLAIGL